MIACPGFTAFRPNSAIGVSPMTALRGD